MKILYIFCFLQIFFSILQVQSQSHKCYAEMGVELFYFILTLVNEESNAYPPTRQFFTQCLERLGQVSDFKFSSIQI